MTKPEHDGELQPSTAAPSVPDDAPPNGGYGWVCCFAMLCINGFTWGILATYGVFLSWYINHDHFPGASALDYTFVGGLNFAAAMLVAPLVNILVKRFGTYKPMYAGCVLWLLGFVLAAEATEFWHLLLTQGLLVGIGTGVTWLPAAPILAQWFTTRRSLAQGIASSGSGIVGVIYSISTTHLIENISLPWALRIIGITSTTMLVIGTILIRDRNAHTKPDIHPFSIKLLRRKGVWMLMGFTFFNVLGYIVSIYSLSAFAISLGYSQSQGGTVIAVLNVGTAIVRPLTGVLSDKFGRITTAVSMTALNVVLSFAWISVTSYAGLVVFALVIGGTGGIYWGIIAPLSAEVVGLPDLPSLLALMWLTVSMPSLFSEAIALQIRTKGSNEFLWTQVYTGLVYSISALFLLELRRMTWGLWKWEKHG